MPPTYVCPACDYVLWDGVDYTFCPACTLPVDWVDTAKPLWCCATCDAFVNEPRDDWPTCATCHTAMASVTPMEQPESRRPADRSLMAAGQVVYAICGCLQLIALGLDRFAFAFIAPIALLLVIAALAILVVTVVGLTEVIVVLRDRGTRVIHGLEHATIAVLDQRGVATYGGVTRCGHFTIEIANGRHASSGAVRDAFDEAMRRILAGERSLLYTRRCGTSIAVACLAASLAIVGGGIAGLIAGLAVNVIAGLVALAIVLAWIAAQPLGLLAQRYLTVSAPSEALRIGTIASEISGRGDRARFLVEVVGA